MKAIIKIAKNNYEVDFNKPIDISIPLKQGGKQLNCFYAPPYKAEPFEYGSFIASTKKGSPVNSMNVSINPHGNGTHTESVGHISKKPHSIHKALKKFMFLAQLITVKPKKKKNGDRIIEASSLKGKIDKEAQALIIRTSPNTASKLSRNYTGKNPPYVDEKSIAYINQQNIVHLLIDLPSIDKEEDGGAVVGHKTFWNYPDRPEKTKTITELIFVDNLVADGLYLLNLQIASFDIDASPSKPILYKIKAL